MARRLRGAPPHTSRVNVDTVCTHEVVTASTRTPLLEGARLMREHHVGALVLVEPAGVGGRRPVGIVTDRDVVVEGVAKVPQKLDELELGDLVTRELITLHRSANIDEALDTFSRAGIRRAPVVDDDGLLIGILAIDDLLENFAGRLIGIVGVISRELRNEKKSRT